MKLRSFFLFASATVLVSSVVAFWALSQSSISTAFKRIETHAQQNVAKSIENRIETKKDFLASLGSLLRYNYDFIGLSVVARETLDRSLLSEEMNRVLRESKIDSFQLVSPRREIEFSAGTKLSEFPANLFDPKSVRTGILVSAQGPTVVSVSPLELYDDLTGFAVLGYNLIHVLREIEGIYGTGVEFSWHRRPSSQLLHLALTEKQPLFVDVLSDRDPERVIRRSLHAELLAAGVAAFLLALFVTYALIEFAFIRKFKTLTRSVETQRKILENNGVPQPIAIQSVISEVQQLSSSFEDFARSIRDYRVRFENEARHAAESTKRAALAELAQQVAHDIRSPIASIDMILLALDNIPSQKRTLLRTCLGRINSIAEKLLAKFRNEEPVLNSACEQSIYVLCEQVLEEKKHRHPNFNFKLRATEDAKLNSFANVEPIEFKILISNLLENAVEASPAAEPILLWIESDPLFITVGIEDRGVGIPDELLERVGKRGATFGKQKGSGLGVSHARDHVESWGGALRIASRTGNETSGTKVEIRLPKCVPPSWAVVKMRLPAQATIAIVDDDPWIHESWRRRFDTYPELDLKHFLTSRDAEEWAKQNGTEQTFYLCDQEIDDYLSGVELLQRIDAGKRGILVSAVDFSEDLRNRCLDLSIGFLAKSQIPHVSIELSPMTLTVL